MLFSEEVILCFFDTGSFGRRSFVLRCKVRSVVVTDKLETRGTQKEQTYEVPGMLGEGTSESSRPHSPDPCSKDRHVIGSEQASGEQNKRNETKRHGSTRNETSR